MLALNTPRDVAHRVESGEAAGESIVIPLKSADVLRVETVIDQCNPHPMGLADGPSCVGHDGGQMPFRLTAYRRAKASKRAQAGFG